MLTKPEVKYIQSLNEKKFRQQEGVFVAEGPKIVSELLSSMNTELVSIYATQQWQPPNQTGTADGRIREVSVEELQKLSSLSAPNQVIGIFRHPVFPADLSFHQTLSLVLDGIQDPGNMGTIIRIADWFGIGQVIASNDSADVFNPKVVQATMGSVARVQVIYEELHSFLQQHRTIPIYAATLEGKPLAFFGQVKEGFVLVGNESKGIRNELAAMAAHRITIQRFGQAESLNAAVATGIILSHIR